MRTEANLKERLDVFGDDLGLGSGEHAQDDDGSSALKPRDLLWRA